MYLFKEYVELKFMEADEVPPMPDPKIYPDIDPQMWATNKRYRDFWFMAHRDYVQVAQQPQKAVARALGPVQGQTGKGLESISAGGRVPSHLVNQIPPGDIAPSWYTAVKYYKGKDGRVYKK